LATATADIEAYRSLGAAQSRLTEAQGLSAADPSVDLSTLFGPLSNGR
jgi:hypothetical protein